MTAPSPTKPSFWHSLLERKLSRRDAIRATAGAAIALPVTLQVAEAASVATANNGAPVKVRDAAQSRRFPPFKPTPASRADTITLPSGYDFQVVAPWGEKVSSDKGEFEIGFNHDYVGFFPMDMMEGGSSSTDALVTINHEYVNPLFVGGNTKERTPEQIKAEMMAVGVSVVRVRKEKDGWQIVQGDKHNRRLDAFAAMELTGPARGSSAVKGATSVKGTVGNCSGGQTPWGTLLTCEENVDGYQAQWNGSGYEMMHQGWVVEIDPFNPSSTPQKHTALGRFRHENAAVTIAKDGRVVIYMGDDKQDACIFKFVTKGKYDASNRAANLKLLEQGELYAADLGKGAWLLIDFDKQAKLKEAKTGDKLRFASQADVLADATGAALVLGATPTDRPEDIEIHPKTGEVYAALTNNSLHGNFFGQIIKITEKDNDATATAFLWDVFAAGGPKSGFGSPDNLVFDPYGNLWMVTDTSNWGGIYEFMGNNAMFFFPTEGPDAGKAYRFATGPVEAEMTGPVWSPDGKTLFVAIQHPGERSAGMDKLTSNFAAKEGSKIPRPTLVAIDGFPGWR